ncbi:MAG: hypothetical protein GXY76_09585 [Chloroflexi bacterium]|nr:hypothetical protein [Chloroflexota bacterium]
MTKEIADLWSAYARRENSRVPITFACDEQVWLKVAGHTFREFYTDPVVHLRAQLEGRRWFSEHVAGDMPPEPEHCTVGVQLWMAENEFFGCEVVYQEDDYAWAMPLRWGRDDLLHYLADLDPEEQVRRESAWRMYQSLRELAEGLSFADRSVEVATPGQSTHGIFTKAAELRGLERMCLDLYEAPDFAERFLELVTDKTIARIKTWHKLTTGHEPELPMDRPFHFCDDSLQLLSAPMYERFVLPCHERLYATMATGERRLHLCGHAAQHYASLRRRLNVTTIDGPGPFVDYGRHLRELGPDFAFGAQTDHSVLEHGSEADVERMMRGMLIPQTKVPGRFQIVGFLSRQTPLRNVKACYQYGRRYGGIGGEAGSSEEMPSPDDSR